MRTRTIEQGFKKFLQALKPTSKESDAAKSYRTSIEACLKSKFGRVLADVFAGDVNIGEYLIENRLAFPYSGGTRAELDWDVLNARFMQ